MIGVADPTLTMTISGQHLHSTWFLLGQPPRKMALEFSLQDYILCLALLVLAVPVYYRWHRQEQLKKNVPWVGALPGPFSKTVAQFRALLHGRDFLEEAYYKVLQDIHIMWIATNGRRAVWQG